MHNREKYRQRLAGKLCGHCGKPIKRPETACAKKICDECLSKASHHGNRTRAQRRLAGQCPHCGNPQDVPNRKNCAACLAKAKERFQDRKSRGVCTKCGVYPNIPNRATCMFCKELDKKRVRDWRDRLIVEVFRVYGGCVCACCGLTEFEFLTLDHINGDGAKHRREMKKLPNTDIYTWVKKQGFPPGFQVLCMNCNWARGKFGECPHKTRAKQAFTFVA